MIRLARLVVMMVRPPVALVLMLFAAIGLAVGDAAGGFHPLFTTVLVVVGGWFVHATVLNDLSDERIDRINLANARGRPLISGEATRKQLLALGLAAGAVSLGVAWWVDPRVGVVVTAGLILNSAYSLHPLRLSGRGALATALLPLGYVVVPFLVGAFTAQTTLPPKALVVLAGLYISFMGRIVLKDFRDVAGDEMFGKRTFLLRYGREATCMFSAACWIGGSAALIAFVPLYSAVVAVFVAYLACALHGLFLLSRADDHTQEQVVIAAIAHVGRGMAITLLAHLTMAQGPWSSGEQTLVHAALAVVFVYAYLDATARRESLSAAAVRPF
ncbi:MAG: UbiA family prenyltransferase [Actinomycetota bacterium]|nr:UbiA family prenyltransferase [Actinomycetota bacterium]